MRSSWMSSNVAMKTRQCRGCVPSPGEGFAGGCVEGLRERLRGGGRGGGRGGCVGGVGGGFGGGGVEGVRERLRGGRRGAGRCAVSPMAARSVAPGCPACRIGDNARLHATGARRGSDGGGATHEIAQRRLPVAEIPAKNATSPLCGRLGCLC